MTEYALLAVIALAGLAYRMAHHRADYAIAQSRQQGQGRIWCAQPVHFGVYAAGKTALLALLFVFAWQALRQPVIEYILMQTHPLPEDQAPSFFLQQVRRLAGPEDIGSASPLAHQWAAEYQRLYSRGGLVVSLGALLIAMAGCYSAMAKVRPSMPARQRVERWTQRSMKLAAYISIAITVLIFLSVIVEAGLFFERVSLWDFLFGTKWSPQTAIREGQAGASGHFGVLPLFAGTLLITAIALLVAVPIGLMSAIYMSEYADQSVRSFGKPMLEVLAGIPTVVYGFFAITVMAPFLRDSGATLGLDVSSESALAAGLVMGIMIIPLVSSLSDDAINAVPRALREASLGLGATPSETIRRVVLPAALPGISGGILLALSRAIGETMIVVMAAGLAANLTINPLESVTTVTVQIVALLVGDQEFDSTKTLAAFGLGLTLFLFTLILNIIAVITVRKYRQAYE